MSGLIIWCSECDCVYGGSNSVGAFFSGWVYRSGKWYCGKCKEDLSKFVDEVVEEDDVEVSE